MQLKTVYLITYPNGKIYVGKDLTGSVNYFGSANEDLIAADMSDDLKSDFTIRKQILWSSETATDADVAAMEVTMIRQYNSNDPSVGYNRWPKHRLRTAESDCQ